MVEMHTWSSDWKRVIIIIIIIIIIITLHYHDNEHQRLRLARPDSVWGPPAVRNCSSWVETSYLPWDFRAIRRVYGETRYLPWVSGQLGACMVRHVIYPGFQDIRSVYGQTRYLPWGFRAIRSVYGEMRTMQSPRRLQGVEDPCWPAQ